MRFFDFFAGIGGFRLGMEMAGHECVGHCEIDKYADLSYRAMHHPKESEVFFSDIRAIEPSDIPECEVYCFGFPCQAFSIAGKRRGFEDTRGTLFFEVMRIAKERKPPILFAENVAGLLNHEEGITFGVILSAMAELGYSVEWQVLDSQYFGVPQHRERVFLVGHLGDFSGREVFPIGTDGEETAELQGRTVTGTLTTRTGEANSVGTFLVDRQTDLKGEWISQEVIDDRYQRPRISDKVVNTICARDYKGGLYVREKRYESDTDRQLGETVKAEQESIQSL